MKKTTGERVIFREDYNIFHECISYIAAFPDDPEFIDRVGILEFCFKNGRVYYEAYGTACYNWIYSKKIIHKNDSRIPALLAALQQHYGNEYEFRVCEKMNNRKNVVYR